MYTNSRPAEPGAVASASAIPAANTTLTPSQEVKWVKQLPLRMKAYARWMKRFLHGEK